MQFVFACSVSLARCRFVVVHHVYSGYLILILRTHTHILFPVDNLEAAAAAVW